MGIGDKRNACHGDDAVGLENAMPRRTSRTDAYAIATAAALGLGGMFLIRSGGGNGWWVLLGCSCAAALVFIRPFLPSFAPQPETETLDVTPWGIRRFDHDGLHEAVSWTDLSEVAVVTSRATHGDEDVYLVLQGQNDNGVMVPHTLAVESGLFRDLETRLRGFDLTTFVKAMTTSVDGVFVLWRAPRAPAVADPARHSLRAAS